jgi:hypothetical protein
MKPTARELELRAMREARLRRVSTPVSTRLQRWRKANRDRYNEYMRAYRNRGHRE